MCAFVFSLGAPLGGACGKAGAIGDVGSGSLAFPWVFSLFFRFSSARLSLAGLRYRAGCESFRLKLRARGGWRRGRFGACVAL